MKRVSALVTAALLCAAPVLAHHSGAMYDSAHPIDVKGQVKTFRWTNPHVYIEVYGTSKTKPEPQVWTIELSSTANVARSGWKRNSLAPGDKVTVSIAPLHSGGPGGGFRSLTFDETGKVLERGAFRSQTAPKY